MGDYFDVQEPEYPSDIIWENLLQPKPWRWCKEVMLNLIFLLGFCFFATGIYLVKSNQQQLASIIPSSDTCNATTSQYNG